MGLMRRRYGYYWTKLVGSVIAVIAWATAFIWVGNSWWQLVSAVVLAVLTIDYFVTPPLYVVTLGLNCLPPLALFALSALLVGWLGVRRRRMADALQRVHDDLDARVRDRTADLNFQFCLQPYWSLWRSRRGSLQSVIHWWRDPTLS